MLQEWRKLRSEKENGELFLQDLWALTEHVGRKGVGKQTAAVRHWVGGEIYLIKSSK